MSQKWNLQDIRPSGGGRRERRRPQRPIESEEMQTEPVGESSHIQIRNGNQGKRFKLVVLLVVFVIIIAGIFASSALLSGAEVTVYPKNREVTVQATFTASNSGGSAVVPYELLTLESEGEQQVTATGQEDVEEQA